MNGFKTGVGTAIRLKKVGSKVIDVKRPIKFFESPDYNYHFYLDDGEFHRWGKTRAEDPSRSPFGPEILDVEVTTKCGAGCPYCYKSNTASGENMSLETFKKVFDKVNENGTVTQVAFGVDAGAMSNSNLFEMSKWLRNERNVIPNGTVADINQHTADLISKFWGACAVSYHEQLGWSKFNDSILALTSRGISQVNVHQMVSEETYEQTLELYHRVKTDPGLQGVNCVVLLGLKPKGRGSVFHRLSDDKFRHLVELAFDIGLRIGFDSCSAGRFAKVIEGWENEKRLLELVEPCESFSCFSAYINVEGRYFPCSFCEEVYEGIDVLKTGSFIDEVWNGDYMMSLHERSLKNDRNCIVYPV